MQPPAVLPGLYTQAGGNKANSLLLLEGSFLASESSASVSQKQTRGWPHPSACTSDVKLSSTEAQIRHLQVEGAQCGPAAAACQPR